MVGPADLAETLDQTTDLLLLRTGYEAYRAEDRYWAKNPGLHPDLGGWLRTEYPTVRVVGMDVISVTSRLHREEGREAHRALLDPERPGDPVLAKSLLLAGIHALLGIVWLGALSTVLGRARAFVRRGSVQRWLEGVSGTVLVGLGVRLAAARA